MNKILDGLLDTACRYTASEIPVCAPPWYTLEWLSTDAGKVFGSALLGAVVGAVIAGGIQAAISSAEFKRQRRNEARDKSERDKALAFNIATKAMTINNQWYSVLGMIVGMLQQAEDIGASKAALFEKIVPMSGISRDPILFSLDEIVMLFTHRENDLANKLLLLNEKNKSLTDVLVGYSDRRSAFGDVYAAGNATAIAIKAGELSEMATAMCVGLSEDFKFCLGVIDAMGATFFRIFGSEEIITAEIADGGAARVQAFDGFLKPYGIVFP